LIIPTIAAGELALIACCSNLRAKVRDDGIIIPISGLQPKEFESKIVNFAFLKIAGASLYVDFGLEVFVIE
jgi:hypothetical protein